MLSSPVNFFVKQLKNCHQFVKFGADPTYFCQGDERGVDGQGEFDGQLRGHYRGQDEGALQEELVAIPVWVLSTCTQRQCDTEDWLQVFCIISVSCRKRRGREGGKEAGREGGRKGRQGGREGHSPLLKASPPLYFEKFYLYPSFTR